MDQRPKNSSSSNSNLNSPGVRLCLLACLVQHFRGNQWCWTSALTWSTNLFCTFGLVFLYLFIVEQNAKLTTKNLEISFDSDSVVYNLFLVWVSSVHADNSQSGLQLVVVRVIFEFSVLQLWPDNNYTDILQKR